MSTHITVGIDNGQSGTIGIIGPDGVIFESVPTLDYLHYGKKGTVSQRLDRQALSQMLAVYLHGRLAEHVHVFIERPFTGKFMNAVLPAHRFFEATIIALEDLGLGYEVIDSAVWQAPVLGKVKGSAELKRASMLRGIQYYPKFREQITKHGDADGLLIAHYFANKGNSYQQP